MQRGDAEMTGLEADTDTVTDGAVRNVVGTPRGVMDVDSHEMIPVELWGEYFSESLHAQVQRARFDIFARQRANPMSAPDISEDATEITYDTVWNLKGIRAPSAIDMDRRPDVLDAMGIRRQLVFPTMGLFALVLRNATNSHEWLGYDPAQVDARALGLEAIEAHNAWAARVTLASGDRVRPAAIVVTDSLDTMVQGAENALAAGVRAFMLPDRKSVV